MGDLAHVDDGASCQEFIDGSIFRVKVHNFLTYSDAEFFPGPRLNLILGPNGTGKSSIVCALCVGLAGSTKLLGRADKVGQFVRHEKETGFTEIELFFERGNRVVRRKIFRDNKSVWYLDGREVPLKRVTSLMEHAKIQIDNLCQFLPQDKVGEFSRMNPMQLLKATETAILDGELAVTHEEIVEMQLGMKDKEQELEAARASLEQKTNENLQREKEVERIVEHEERIEETRLMEKKCLWLEFEEIKRRVDELKVEKQRRQEEMEAAKEEKVAPLKELLEKATLRVSSLQEERTESKRTKRDLEDKLKRAKQHVENLEVTQGNTISELAQLRNQHAQSKRKLERLEQELEEWKRERSEMEDEAFLKQQKVTLERELRAKELEHAEVSSKREARSREYSGIEEERRRVQNRLSRFQDQNEQRLQALRRFDPDAVRAYEWVTKNQHKLKRKVWGPVSLEVKVNDALHASYVEDALQKYVFGSLVTECFDDYNVIIDELKAANIRSSVINVEGGNIHQRQRPYSGEQMETFRRDFGISGYLDELITAPDIIHEVLREHGGVHTVLVGSQQTESMINQNVNVFGAISVGDKKSALMTPAKKYVTSVSKYGNRNVTTRTNDIREPRLLAASTSNDNETNALQTKLTELSSRLSDIQEEISMLKAQERTYSEARNTTSPRIMEIRTQLKNMIRLDERIHEGENKAYSLRSELSKDLSDSENGMIRKLKGQASKQAKHLRECLTLTKELLVANANDTRLSIQVSSQQVRVEATERHLKQADAALVALKNAYKQAKEDLLALAKEAMHLKRKAERDAPWDEHEEAFGRLSDDLDELRGCIENNKASLECFRGDLSLREVYQRVCEEIEEEKKILANLEGDVTHGEDRINAIKETWHAKLRDIIGQIDESFKEFFRDIGCVGEIVLDDSDPDISKWGIERRAQFRKNAKLSTMTAEEQSGGEKSVGTIMYLMALQSLTKCPFRVVDEINQGMDVYNERKVFSRITKSSCGSKLPQYFLITPKLITGLHYHRDTKVMIILNGPWNQIHQEEWDIDRFLSGGHKRASDANGHPSPSHKRQRISAR